MKKKMKKKKTVTLGEEEKGDFEFEGSKVSG